MKRPVARSGLTLLEVLIAAGILVVGLSSIAALLPAAGSLLGDAVTVDRAVTLAANAAADLDFRQTFTAAQFVSPTKSVMVGNIFSAAVSPSPFAASPFTGTAYTKIASIPKTTVDDQAYGLLWYVATATPLATSGNMTAGMPIRVSVAVLKSPTPDVKVIDLTRMSAGIYRIGTGTAIQNEGDRKLYFPGCAWVLVTNNGLIRWLRIGSSWALYNPGLATLKNSYLSFIDSDTATAFESGGVLKGYAISGVIRVEERIIPLN
jgi:Tfp pilus assembly protein PilV